MALFQNLGEGLMRKRTFDDFCAAVEGAAPGSAIEELDNGELVVFTGFARDFRTNTVEQMTDEDFDRSRPITDVVTPTQRRIFCFYVNVKRALHGWLWVVRKGQG